VLEPDQKKELYALAHSEDLNSGNQVLVATFSSLEKEDLVDFTNRLFKKWNPGQKGRDNGVILAIFLKERKIRIETGYGLEPILTDASSKRIIETAIKPEFKAGNYGDGLIAGCRAILEIIGSPRPDASPSIRKTPSPSRSSKVRDLVWAPVWIFLFWLFIRNNFFRRRNITFRSGGSSWGSSSGFGGLGGGGFGGGGFSGGGGSSGGGGASGDW
jgi:uncharacterized protein